MSDVPRISLVIVDDHAVVRDGLKLLINTQTDMMVIGEAEDGEVALRLVPEARPDIVLLDLAMRGLHGMATAIKLKQLVPDSKILAYTVHEGSDMVREMMEVGAAGYVLKRSHPEELLTAVRTVAKGGTYLDKAVAPEFNRTTPRPGTQETAALSSRENEVLRLLAAGHTNKDIAETLGVSVKTVETYKARLMAKLNMHSRVDMVKYAARRGWLSDL